MGNKESGSKGESHTTQQMVLVLPGSITDPTFNINSTETTQPKMFS